MKGTLIVGGASSQADMLYATGGFYASSAFYIEARSGKYLIVPELEYGLAKKIARDCRVLLYSDIDADPSATTSDIALGALRKIGIDSCIMSADTPASIYRDIQNSGITVTLKGAWTLFHTRERKSAAEVELIVNVQRVAEKAFDAVLECLQASSIEGEVVKLNGRIVTSEWLQEIFEIECLKGGCTNPEGVIFASGAQGADPHHKGEGPILPNTFIVCDMFPRSRKTSYWSDMTRTVVKGRASSGMRKMYETVLEAQERAIEMVRPGIDGHLIDAWIREFFDSKGYETKKAEGFFHSTGHGIGLGLHEGPRLGKTKGSLLKEGSVITIEPGLYYREMGGVRIEDMVLVTQGGHRNLAKTPKKLLEIP